MMPLSYHGHQAECVCVWTGTLACGAFDNPKLLGARPKK